MDHEKFDHFASGLQAIATCIGLVVAGVWVVYTFWALGSTNKARAEIAALEQAAIEQPVLQMSVSAAASANKRSEKKRTLDLSVKLENSGKRAVEFEAPMLRAALLIGGRDGATPTAAVHSVDARAVMLSEKGQFEPMIARILRAGQSRTVVFSIPVVAAGNYFVQVESDYRGMTLIDGAFRPSSDQPIHAFEQAIVSIE